MRVLSATPAVNAAIAAARGLPSLIAGLRAVDPQMVVQLESKPLLASRSPWGTLLAGMIGWASARYGLGLDRDTTAIIAGVCVLAGGFIMRWLTRQPVAGLVTTPPTAASPHDPMPIPKPGVPLPPRASVPPAALFPPACFP